MDELTKDEVRVLRAVLDSVAFQNLIGAEEWHLSEEDEDILWGIIKNKGHH